MIERCELAPGYSISRVIHGGWQFSSGHRLSGDTTADPLAVLFESAELGVTTFDCADIYTGVEELYGRFVREWGGRAGAAPVQVHTKFVPDASDLANIDRAYVERIIDRSRERLGVERLDLVQYYWWRDEIPGMEQTAVWLQELKEEGRIRHLGVTNFDPARIERIRDAGVTVVSDQVQYSALDRRPEHGLADYCRDAGLGIIAFGTLAGGFLTGRWSGAPDDARWDNRSLVKYRLIIDEFGGWAAYQQLLKSLREIGEQYGVEASSVAVRFVLEQPAVSAVIAGATRLGQMRRNVEAFSFRLTDVDRRRIRALVDAAPGPRGEVFDLERDRDGPHGRIMKYDLNRD